MKSKIETSNELKKYMARFDSIWYHLEWRLTLIRCDNGWENLPNELYQHCASKGMELKKSPAYAPQSNGLAERIVQDHWTRTRILLFSCAPPQQLAGEAIHHPNGLRNRSPSTRIDNDIPLLLWNPHQQTSFRDLLPFGQHGYSFVYRSHTSMNKKCLPRSILSHFVGQENDSRLIRVFIPADNWVHIIRRVDFHPTSDKSDEEQLPSFQTLIDGISLEMDLDGPNSIQQDGDDALMRSLSAISF